MKRVFLGITLSSAIIVLTFSSQAVASTSLVEPDGSKGGTYVETVDGKDIIDYPVSAEIKEQQQKKGLMAEFNLKYKKGEISQKAYISKLKDLGASEDTISTAYGIKTFDTENSLINGMNSLQPFSLSSTKLNVIIPFWQIPQQTTYFCGPATASEIIRAKAFNTINQYDLATPLHCTTDGTPWYDGSYPMRDTLNSYLNTSFYTPYGTTVTASDFQSFVIYDIDQQYGTAGDAWEVPGGPHLVGHPVNSTIYHWFAIFGYDDYGNTIHYKDSVAGSTVSWSGSVPESSSMNYATLATIVNGRGIIW